jgi:hypothetical protein
MIDGTTAFGSFAEKFLTEVHQEFPKSTRLTLCDVSIPNRPKVHICIIVIPYSRH